MEPKCEICGAETNQDREDEYGADIKLRGGGKIHVHIGCLIDSLEAIRDTRVTEIRLTYRNPDLP